MEWNYINNCLTAKEYIDYEVIADAIRNRKPKVKVSLNTDIKNVMTLVYDSFPELFYVSRKYQIITGMGKRWVEINYIYSESQTANYAKKIESVTSQFIRKYVENTFTDYDKEKVVYDYLKNNLTYDFQDATGSGLLQNENAHNLVGALIDKRCVCDGFAAAMKYLCNLLGIECICVSGTARNKIMSGSHAWNIVCIHGVNQHVDVTWDNKNLLNSDIDNYVYFNVDDQYMSRDHSWNRSFYPLCRSAPYNYFKVNDAIISSEKHMLKFIRENLDNEETDILFRIDDECKEAEQLFSHKEQIIQKAISMAKYAKVKAFQYSYYEEHKIISIKPEYLI